MTVLQIIRLVLGLGMPPSIDDEPALRGWCRKLAEVWEALAKLTDTMTDDQIVAGIAKLVTTDAYWTALYAILDAASQYLSDEDQRAAAGSSGKTAVLAEEASIDPSALVAIIGAILQIIDWWRNR